MAFGPSAGFMSKVFGKSRGAALGVGKAKPSGAPAIGKAVGSMRGGSSAEPKKKGLFGKIGKAMGAGKKSLIGT